VGAEVIRRVVLDTNVLVSALLFTGGRVAWLRHAWQHGYLVPIACRQTVTELVRVIAYPKFKLTSSERDDLLGDALPYTEIISLPEPWPELPECRDPADQVFLALTTVARADALVTGDDDLLELGGETGFTIMTPAQLREARPDLPPLE